MGGMAWYDHLPIRPAVLFDQPLEDERWVEHSLPALLLEARSILRCTLPTYSRGKHQYEVG